MHKMLHVYMQTYQYMTIGTGEIYKKDVFSVRGTDYFGMVKE